MSRDCERGVGFTCCRGICILSSALLLAIGMISCAPAENTKTPRAGVDGSYSSAEEVEIEESYEDDYSIPMADIEYLSGAFLLNAEGTGLEDLEVSETLAYDNVVGWDSTVVSKEDSFYISSGGEAVTIDRGAGEKLVLVGEAAQYHHDAIDLRVATDWGYWQGPEVSGRPSSYEEIEGTSMEGLDGSSLADFLSGFGLEYHWVYYGGNYNGKLIDHCDELYMIVSDEPTVLSAGFYKDTKWIDGSIPVQTPYYCCTGKQEVSVMPTKEGYFEVDVSELDPGVYYFDLTVDDLEYAVEIL